MGRKPVAPLLGLLALLAACPPESENPLSSPKGAVIDQALLGVWAGDDGQGTKLELHIAVKEGGVMSIVDPRKGEPLKFEAHATALGARKYLNVRLIDGDDVGGYVIVRYELRAGGKLSVWTMGSGVVRTAMESGALKARSSGGGLGGIVITDTPEKVIAFINAGKGDKLWEKFGTFERVKGR